MYVSFSSHGERHIWWFRKSILRDTWMGSDGIPAKSRGARTWIVRQYLHLLPRSVIYFEDFLSSCTPRAARRFLYALCVGRDWNIFLPTRQREARRDIFPCNVSIFSKMKKKEICTTTASYRIYEFSNRVFKKSSSLERNFFFKFQNYKF